MTERKEANGKEGVPPAAWLADFGRHSTLGITFVATFLVFGGIGYLVDGPLGTYPLFLILGIFVGAALGFVKLYYTVFPQPRPRDKSKEEQ